MVHSRHDGGRITGRVNDEDVGRIGEVGQSTEEILMKYLKRLAFTGVLLVSGGGVAVAGVFNPAKLEIPTEAHTVALEGIEEGTDIAPVSWVPSLSRFCDGGWAARRK